MYYLFVFYRIWSIFGKLFNVTKNKVIAIKYYNFKLRFGFVSLRTAGHRKVVQGPLEVETLMNFSDFTVSGSDKWCNLGDFFQVIYLSYPQAGLGVLER